MKVIGSANENSEIIENFESVGARSLRLAAGEGEAHIYSLHFEASGQIGKHVAGFGQLFLVVEGSGWVIGGDGERQELATGDAAFIARGESHSKGSELGMKAIMVQVRDLEPAG